ncbi:MAG: hypothetical protein F6K28_49820 [Microcoleus sp. SIO2G3]|nr:hypothetical protein [Microcoleus sp. SIO2G3]
MVSAELGNDIAVIQFDQGSFHTVKTQGLPRKYYSNFPTHSPEFNPIERFWEFLKSKLQWENCKTLAQLRSYVS